VKKDEDEFFFRGKGKKNKREKAAARNKVRIASTRRSTERGVLQVSESLTHVADIFTGFAKLELQPPLLLSDVAASIEALKAKKACRGLLVAMLMNKTGLCWTSVSVTFA